MWLLVRWFQTLGKTYRITTRRIVVETGVLSKKLEQIDLYRVADLPPTQKSSHAA